MALSKKKNNRTGYLFLMLFLAGFHWLGMRPVFSGQTEPDCKAGLFIQVEGTIPNPGVYLLCPGQDLATLLHKTGYEGATLSPNGGLGQLISGNRILVAKTQESPQVTADEMSAFFKLTLAIPLSLNKETEEGLCAIPGIGPGLAQKITAERTKRGGFRDVSEVMTVKGIGPKKFEKFRPFLTL
jgi:competence protein ComEA